MQIAIRRNESGERLILTAKDFLADVARGLDLGADDYLTKPFQLEVFLARVRAVGRRVHNSSASSTCGWRSGP